jgi:hypothetical protein
VSTRDRNEQKGVLVSGAEATAPATVAREQGATDNCEPARSRRT